MTFRKNYPISKEVMNNKLTSFVSVVFVVTTVTINPSFALEKNTVSNLDKISHPSSEKMQLAQGMGSRVIKLRLSDSGVSVGSVIAWGLPGLIQKRSTDWVRLEINENQVRVIHTTRATNAFTQFSKWWDHPVRKIAFKPDSCKVDNVQNQGGADIETKLRDLKKSYDSKLITEQEYQNLRNKIINQINTTPNQSSANNSDCIVSQENGVIELQNISLLTQGVFNIEYLESGEWKYAAFRVPAGQ
jgi:hypothetical protein